MTISIQPGSQSEEVYYKEREAAVYDLEYQWKRDDVDYWITLAKEYAGGEGTVLELGCGTGRVLVPMAESGVRVVGVDQSPWMMAKAKEKYERLDDDVQSRIGLLEGDMRTLRLEQKFDLIYIPFNTFLILKTVQDQLAVFEVARRHLRAGGAFAFDVFVPDVKRLAGDSRPPEWVLEVDQTLGELGTRLHRDMVRLVDPIRQHLLVTWRVKEYRDNVLEREWLTDLEMSYIFPRELEHLVARAGFEFARYWGSYDRVDFLSVPQPIVQLPVLKPR